MLAIRFHYIAQEICCVFHSYANESAQNCWPIYHVHDVLCSSLFLIAWFSVVFFLVSSHIVVFTICIAIDSGTKSIHADAICAIGRGGDRERDRESAIERILRIPNHLFVKISNQYFSSGQSKMPLLAKNLLILLYAV